MSFLKGEIEEKIEKLRERLAQLKRELEYYTGDGWQSVWKGIDPDDLTPDQEEAWQRASATAEKKRRELPGLIEEVEAEIAELEN